MQLAQFGEKSFIQQILGTAAATASPEAFDDAVVIDLSEFTDDPDAPYLVYSLDQPSFVRHPNTDLDPYRFYGRWIAGTTCNDVVAMGARCRGFSLALAAPPDAEVADIECLVKGINEVLVQYGAIYEGGNLDSSALATVGFAWGVVGRRSIVRRSGARPGDRIVVTGELGLGWLEYLLRRAGLADRVAEVDQPALRAYKSMPMGAAAPIEAAAREGWLTSGMDLSDGLVEFLYTVANRNSLGCVIDSDRLPVSQVTRRNLHLLAEISPSAAEVLATDPGLAAFDPGYDSPMRHAFTVPADVVEQARALFATHGHALEVVGTVVDAPGVVLDRGGRHTEIPPFWDDQLRVESSLDAWTTFLEAFR